MPRIKRTAAEGGNGNDELSLSPLKARSKKQDEKDKSKQRILDSATKLFAQKGYDGVGIREICKEANANICMISYFWGGKQELYKGIVDNLIEKQTEYAKSFLNLDIEPSTLSKQEQINLLYTVIDKVIEFLYGGLISDDLFRFLLQEQQSRSIELTSPVFVFVRKLIGAIFNKDMNDKDIIFKTVFIMSQINSPKILPAFSLSLLRQDTFSMDDKEIIRNNAKLYVDTLIKEAEIV